MGFGDPDHHHALGLHRLEEDVNCFRCQSHITSQEECYGCTRCSHYVHQVCFGLPEKMRHPLHPKHVLTLLPSPTTEITSDCYHCHKPLLGGYSYKCQECLQVNFHLKCFLALNLSTKHCHSLRLYEIKDIYEGDMYELDCRICGLLIDDFESYTFGCKSCNFFVHFDCTSIPPTVKHRHVHELTFEYNFPEKSKLADCDVCLNKDKDGEELDRTLSYYYCDRCDYIAHVRCVTSQPEKVTTQFENFIHEHPMVYSRKAMDNNFTCVACEGWRLDSFYVCTLCNYALHKSCAQFPRFINHPHHKNHKLSLQSSVSLDPAGKLLLCSYCSWELEGGAFILQCSDCDFAEHLCCACHCFEHPFHENKLSFSTYRDHKFRCDACGELGDGFRMSNRLSSETQLDLHVECFGLPGQIEHGCHSHPLYLVTSPTEIGSCLSSVFQCDTCHTEADPDLWVYCCIECKYVAHLKCVVSNLLPTSGLSNNISNLFSITVCEKEKFRVRTNPVETICSRLAKEGYARVNDNPVFSPMGFFEDPKPPIGVYNDQPDAIDLDNSLIDLIDCPECEQPISAQAYSCVYDWVHCNLKADIYTYHNQAPADNESLVLLDEKVVDELYCPICNLLIFPPTYSCADCQIFFHKSCAELPRKYTVDAGHVFVLQSPSLNSHSLSNCSYCKCPFKGYAYFCISCKIVIDVTCALGAPLLKPENQKHSLCATSWKRESSLDLCKACDHQITKGTIFFRCVAHGCCLYLHVECAMLPSLVKVKRKIHHHPLVLEPHLDLSVDDYICDVCEKELNPCIWVYRCSDICGDRATFHVSCIVTSNKKCHFIYDEECSYPHLEHLGQYNSLKHKMSVSTLAAALVNEPPQEQEKSIRRYLFSLIDEHEHEYAFHVTSKLMEMDQAEVLDLMKSPDALRAKVADMMKDLTSMLPDADDKDVGKQNDEDDEDDGPEIKLWGLLKVT